MSGFSKIAEAASKLKTTKTKLATGLALSAIIGYIIQKRFNTINLPFGLKNARFPFTRNEKDHRKLKRSSVGEEVSGSSCESESEDETTTRRREEKNGVDGEEDEESRKKKMDEWEKTVTNNNNNNNTNKDKQTQIKVNRKFFRQLARLLRILFPKIWSQQFALLALQTLTLLCRTWLSYYVARMEGALVKTIVKRDMIRFIYMLGLWLGIAVPATFVNSLIRFLESKLALAFRSRLVTYAYEAYLKNLTYYKVSNLDGRLTNVDQCLTDDLATFSTSLSHLYSHLTKPVFDIVIIAFTLRAAASNLGASIRIPGLIGGALVYLTAKILRTVSPSFGRLVAEEADKRGNLRNIHSRIIANAEEIAFYDGAKAERVNLLAGFEAVAVQARRVIWKKLWYVQLEQFLMKYVWSACGLVMIAIPIVTSGGGGSRKKEADKITDNIAEEEEGGFLGDQNCLDGGVSDRTESFTTSKNLLIAAGDAVERLMSSYKEIIELAGYTSRVSIMLHVFDDVSNGKYKRPFVTNDKTNDKTNKQTSIVQSLRNNEEEKNCLTKKINNANGEQKLDKKELTIGSGNHVLKQRSENLLITKQRSENLLKTKQRSENLDSVVVAMPTTMMMKDNLFDLNYSTKEKYSQKKARNVKKSIICKTVHSSIGKVVETDHDIILEEVPIITPNGETVVSKLSFKLESNAHLIITGPNGCGKSSLFRILSGLWPVQGGCIYKPDPASMFYIPQRPYTTVGSLRQQIIYPDSRDEMMNKGLTDQDLEQILAIVHLKHILRRKNGWETECDWKDVLSGGEKQKVGMARIFYHKPKYVLLDECTSAISIDVEGSVYQMVKDAGITLLTITHRPSLWKFHTHLLEFDGAGGYKFERLTSSDQVAVVCSPSGNGGNEEEEESVSDRENSDDE